MDLNTVIASPCIPHRTQNEKEPPMARIIAKPKTTSRAVKAKPAKKSGKK